MKTSQQIKQLSCFFLLLFIVIGSSFQSSCSEQKKQLNIVTTLPWSIRMAESVMKRSPDPTKMEDNNSLKWEYTFGLTLKGIQKVWEKTENTVYLDYIKTYFDSFLTVDGDIKHYKLFEYNIDRINPGKVLFGLYQQTGDEKYQKAILLLRKQMATHPRTSEGGFWHKKIYPHQMWLDGIYMASPFLAQFGQTFNEPALFDDIARQIILMEKHARDEKTGLLYHGWDESREQDWANPTTGQSPNFWGRAMGWYAMALVDVLDFMPLDHPQRPEILAILNRLVAAVTNYQNEQTGLWYQVVDQGEREGNYLEASVSSMLVYSLLKAGKKGYIDTKFIDVARKGYEGILKHLIKVDPDGEVHITNVCAVAGLGGNPYRDGS
ncbi:glycoside hydrolase family 88 protein, partial [candidate division KSB1 bacterium]|nr:glycoside hydrolase family 88 protein [candidate division KSB1 bacterium]